MDISMYKVFKLFDLYMYGLLAMYKKRVLKIPRIIALVVLTFSEISLA